MTFLLFLALERKVNGNHWLIDPSEHPNELKSVASIMKNVISNRLKDALVQSKTQKSWIRGDFVLYRKVIQRIHKDLAKDAAIIRKTGEISGPLIGRTPEVYRGYSARQLGSPVKHIEIL